MLDQDNQMMSEETILKGNFIFVSYNHSDKDIVAKDVALLHQKGVRLWFDVNMHASDNWKEVAEKCIKHPNCVGVLFYNSKYSFLSEPCELERQMTKQRIKENNAFKYWFVNLGGTTKEIRKEANKLAAELDAKDGGDRGDRLFEYNEVIQLFFNENMIYIHPDAVANDMVKEAALVGAVDEVGQALKVFKEDGRIKEGRQLIELGVFIEKKYLAPLDHEKKPYERFEINGQKFITFDNVIYTAKPLKWYALATRDGYTILICDSIIAKSQGGQAAKEYLAHFKETAFKENEILAMDKPARLLSLKDLEGLNDEEKEKIFIMEEKPFGDIHYWLDEQGLMVDYQMTCKDNMIYKKGFLILDEKGIRPIIEIPNNKIDEFKKER